LSQESLPGSTGITGRKVAILIANGVEADSVETVRAALAEQGAAVELLAPVDGVVLTSTDESLPVSRAMNTVGSVLYDAVIVADGPEAAAALAADGYAVHFVAETYKHAKALGIIGSGERVVDAARLPIVEASDRIDAPSSKPMAGALDGVVIAATGDDLNAFIADLVSAIAQHRHYERPVDGIAA
jgi:catalase